MQPDARHFRFASRRSEARRCRRKNIKETETDMHSHDTSNNPIFALILERDESIRTAADAMLIANELRETADLYMEDDIDIEDLREQNKITWTEARRLNVVETVRSILRNQANLTNEGR